MEFKIIKQYINKDIKILFLYILDGTQYLFIKPKLEKRAFEGIPSSFCIDDSLFDQMKEVNKNIKKSYKNYTIPYVDDFFIENDDLNVFNKNQIFMELYSKIIYYLKTKKYEIIIDKKLFTKFYNDILELYNKNKYILINFETIYIMDQDMYSRMNYILTNNIICFENIIFKNEVDIFDNDIIINQQKIKNVYYETLQDLDKFYYYFDNNIYLVSKVTEKRNDSFKKIIENKSGYNNGYYFRLIL